MATTATTTEPLLAAFLPPQQAAAELGVCKRTLDRWRKLGEGPPVTKLGRRVLYRRSSLEAFLLAREQRTSADVRIRSSSRGRP
jgi:predicted site-specific integrase-resolvase